MNLIKKFNFFADRLTNLNFNTAKDFLSKVVWEASKCLILRGFAMALVQTKLIQSIDFLPFTSDTCHVFLYSDMCGGFLWQREMSNTLI